MKLRPEKDESYLLEFIKDITEEFVMRMFGGYFPNIGEMDSGFPNISEILLLVKLLLAEIPFPPKAAEEFAFLEEF
jgi:hypothetical protein